MARLGPRRFGVFVMSAVMLMASFGHVAPASAVDLGSTVLNLIATNESGEPLDASGITTISDNENLWAYVTTVGGGVVCVTAGKAAFKYVSSIDGSTLFESGNATFTATVVDTGARGGTGDTLAFRAVDKTRAVLVDLGPTPLGGGNVVAHIT